VVEVLQNNYTMPTTALQHHTHLHKLP